MNGVVYTIGHSNHSLDRFVELLRQHGMTAVGDVRSQPYSRFHSQFNREDLDAGLRSAGISYVFLGKELGARSEDEACYEVASVQEGLFTTDQGNGAAEDCVEEEVLAEILHEPAGTQDGPVGAGGLQHRLVALLPPVLDIDAWQDEGCGWLQGTLRPGGETVITHLADSCCCGGEGKEGERSGPRREDSWLLRGAWVEGSLGSLTPKDIRVLGCHADPRSVPGFLNEGYLPDIRRSLQMVEFFDLDAVISYAERLGSAITAARVGFYLQQHRESLMVEETALDALRELAPHQPSYFDASRESGRLVDDWNLIVSEHILSPT